MLPRAFVLVAVAVAVSVALAPLARAAPPTKSASATSAAPPSPASPVLAALAKKGPLRVGMHPGASPFAVAGADADDLRRRLAQPLPPEVRATDGRLVAGFDVDLVAEAARQLGVPLEITLVDRFEDLLPGLIAGRYDVVASALTRTLDRALTVAFTAPYFATGLALLARDPKAAASLEVLRERRPRVAFAKGTTAERFVARELATATARPLPSMEALFAEMDDPAGADAFVVDLVAARDAVVRKRVKAALASVEERRFTAEQLALAVRQGDPDWLGWLDLYLTTVRGNGQFHRIAARYNDWFRTER